MNPYFKPFTRPPDVNCYACQDLNRIQKYDNLGDSQLEYHLISQIPLMVSEHQETLKDLSQWKAFKYDRDDILEVISIDSQCPTDANNRIDPGILATGRSRCLRDHGQSAM